MTHHIDLASLPAPRFAAALSVDELRDELITKVRADWEEFDATAESDPIRIVVDACAYALWIHQERTELAARRTLLAFAAGANLEHIAALFGIVKLADESDESLRARVLLAPAALSVAGPFAAYETHALAIQGVSAAGVNRPAVGEISVAILSTEDDRVPSAALVAAVQAALDDDDVRPATDDVTVIAGAELTYDVTAELSILPGPSEAVVRAAAEAALRAYAATQSGLGDPVTLSGLIAALVVNGVWKVALSAPAADLAPTYAQAPTLDTLTVTVA